MANSKKNKTLTYKGLPLLRHGNTIYYGSMTDSHIIKLQILSSKEENGLETATSVAVELHQTGAALHSKAVKSTEKNSLWSAMDIATIWLKRANSAK